MSFILDTIVDRKKEEVELLYRNGIQIPREFADKPVETPRGFIQSLLSAKGVGIIAEAKKASPSKGVICENFFPIEIARNYEKQGASCISVLTDEQFFQGCLLYLMQARAAVKLPVIRKDFIIDPLQIDEAACCGADAILLIAAILEQNQLADYHDQAEEKGMDVLVEVHDEAECEMVLETGRPRLLGVNNRNLRDFTVNIETTFRLQKMVPPEIPLVSESGLTSVADMKRLRDAGIAGALIGETLMRAGEKSELLQALRGGQ